MLSDEAIHHRDQALLEWGSGRYYEAHENLEDFAECFPDDDPSFEWALAITRVAACLHKLSSSVGVKAVPGKLQKAIDALVDAPSEWCGIDVETLRSDLQALAKRIGPVAKSGAVPADLHYPILRTIAAEPKRR